MTLFLQTPPISVNPTLLKVLKILLKNKDSGGVLQTKLGKLTSIDKTTITDIKTDLMRLGWCQEVDVGSGKEVALKVARLNEVNAFLRGLDSLQHTIPVRPHHILVKGSFKEKPGYYEKWLDKLTEKYPVEIMPLKNDKKYRFETQKGTFTLMKKGLGITYWIESFVLPVSIDDVPYLEEYIENEITNRVNALHSIIKMHFHPYRIHVSDILVLKSFHIGLLTKKNLADKLSISHSLRRIGLHRDDSVYGLDEHECEGGDKESEKGFDTVVNIVRSALQSFFEKQAEQENGEEQN